MTLHNYLCLLPSASCLISTSTLDVDQLSTGNLLDSFSVPATSSVAVDNSAVFLGVVSEKANISRLIYSSSVDNRAIGINDISISNSDNQTTPESSLIFGLLMVAGFGIKLRKKKRTPNP